MLGHLWALGQRPLEFLASLPAHGDLVEIGLGTHNAYVVCEPNVLHHVLRDARTFDKGGLFFDQTRAAIGNGLATCSYEEHRRLRRLMQPAFHPDRMAGYAAIMTEHIGAVMQSWRDGQVIDLPTVMNESTAHVVTRTLFTASLTTAQLSDVLHCVTTIIEEVFWRMLTPTGLQWLPTPGNRRFRHASNLLDQLIYHMISRSRCDGGSHDDLLSTLVNTRGDHGDSLTDQEIRDQVIIFIIGGTESTAYLVSWAFHHLAGNLEAQQRLRAEVDTVLTRDSYATHADVPRLDYTQRVLTESLRLCPPGWILSRRVTVDTHLAGQRLPAGTILLYSPYLIHQRADLYPHPTHFDPDRWHPDHPHPPRNAYTSFGGGARKCIGDTFAMLEATIFLATISAHWQLHPLPGVTTRPRVRASLRPQPLPMRLQERRRQEP